MKLFIQLQFEYKLFLELFYLLSTLYFYLDKIIIYSNKEYYLFLQQLFFNINNVKICVRENIDENNISQTIIFKNINDFLEKLSLNIDVLFIQKISNNFNYKLIYRNLYDENNYYLRLTQAIGKDYIFYYNKDTNKIINYFGNMFIYNPFHNFYDKENETFYKKWISLDIKNIFQYLTILKHSNEIHIYDIDFLHFIIEFNDDFEHIKNKYIYTNDIFIKNDKRLENWKTILTI